jgi:acyl carrier protein
MNTYKSVIEIMNEVMNTDVSKFGRDDNLSKILDSLAFIKLLIAIESKLNISIDDEDINYEKFNSINAVIKYIDDELANQQ